MIYEKESAEKFPQILFGLPATIRTITAINTDIANVGRSAIPYGYFDAHCLGDNDFTGTAGCILSAAHGRLSAAFRFYFSDDGTGTDLYRNADISILISDSRTTF